MNNSKFDTVELPLTVQCWRTVIASLNSAVKTHARVRNSRRKVKILGLVQSRQKSLKTSGFGHSTSTSYTL